MKIKRFVKD